MEPQTLTLVRAACTITRTRSATSLESLTENSEEVNRERQKATPAIGSSGDRQPACSWLCPVCCPNHSHNPRGDYSHSVGPS